MHMRVCDRTRVSEGDSITQRRVRVSGLCFSVRENPACPWQRREVMAALSNYALRMARLSSRIFGEVAHPTDSRSLKVVQMFQEPPLAKRKEVYDWYPQHKIYYAMTQKLRYMGLFRDEHEDFKEEMRRLRKLRGKGTPKKGEGKRAAKKK
ncbi:28S ribosomal protein S33, mitochondrial isoform X1 [Oryzias latipes]|nr:28S ribosomal protein S33, mitochondrial isoform X1 [Oryzias latipes]